MTRTSFEQELRYRTPGTLMLGIRESDGARTVAMADDIVAADLDQVNRLLVAETERLRTRGHNVPDPEPVTETADGRLVLDGEHTYRLVRRDRRRPSTAIYERIA